MSEPEEFDLSQPEKAKAPLTLLDRLRQKAFAETTNPVVMMPIPKRDGVALKISPNLEDDDIERLRKSATGAKNQFNSFKFACKVIAQTTIGFYIDGEEVFDENGNQLTFVSPDIKEMFGGHGDVIYVVKECFGNDAHVLSAAGKIVDLAGYGDEVQTEDPFLTS